MHKYAIAAATTRILGDPIGRAEEDGSEMDSTRIGTSQCFL